VYEAMENSMKVNSRIKKKFLEISNRFSQVPMAR